MNKVDNTTVCWQRDRQQFFALAKEAGMVDSLAQIAKVFGRFQSASIELADGRTANYTVPTFIHLQPIDMAAPAPCASQQSHTESGSNYAKVRGK